MLNETNRKTTKMVLMAIFTALAYVSVLLIRVPVVMFLSYEPKDVFILLAALIIGPFEGLVVSVVTSFIEMFTISQTGWWGLLMNVLSTVAFILPPALLYKKFRKDWSVAVGVCVGTICMTMVMLLWNYLVAPLYMNVPREQIVPLLATMFLPFNLLKAILNSGLTMILFVPLKAALTRSNLLLQESEEESKRANRILTVIVAALIIITGILFISVLKPVLFGNV